MPYFLKIAACHFGLKSINEIDSPLDTAFPPIPFQLLQTGHYIEINWKTILCPCGYPLQDTQVIFFDLLEIVFFHLYLQSMHQCEYFICSSPQVSCCCISHNLNDSQGLRDFHLINFRTEMKAIFCVVFLWILVIISAPLLSWPKVSQKGSWFISG